MSATAVQNLSTALAKVDDCRECAELLVGQLAEHGVDASPKQLAQVLENVVADAGVVLLCWHERIVGLLALPTWPRS
jgi:hypothetical protein